MSIGLYKIDLMGFKTPRQSSLLQCMFITSSSIAAVIIIIIVTNLFQLWLHHSYFSALASIADVGSSIRLLLFVILLTVIASWIHLFVISIRSHLLTPTIPQKKQDRAINGYYSIIKPEIKLKQFEYNDDQNSTKAVTFPFVSVIIPARDEQDHIENCLLSLLSQSYPNFEVIAIDDNSTDNTLRMMKDIQSMEEESKSNITGVRKLKVISIKEKPDKWTGKTWASQQGYLQSQGDILLFTDADAYFSSRDTISLAVFRMHKEKLDVLTGVPWLRLHDFWSKVVMPVWMLFSEVLDMGLADLNSPKSGVAYVMGSFFMIKRDVFEALGTYESVSHAIQEDADMGALIKKLGYNLKIFKIDDIVWALFSRDLTTLWHGIRRTLAPVAMKSKFRLLAQLFILSFMALLPFILLPYALLPMTTGDNNNNNSYFVENSFPFLVHTIMTTRYSLTFSFEEIATIAGMLVPFLNILCCLVIIIASGVKAMKKYHSKLPIFCILSPIGGAFLAVAYSYHIVSLLRTQVRSVVWRGRTYIYRKDKLVTK
jgi:glycosyltransferase involved in cell wall biosynthesis